MGRLIHPNAWKEHSPNFVLRGFYEVRVAPVRHRRPSGSRTATLVVA
jgi:hypothetical protein